ncbi:hypothetical protein LT330_008027 [Penicillium expansum]|nr:hypothetical protein LT330_008027 [Penicillium expansum]
MPSFQMAKNKRQSEHTSRTSTLTHRPKTLKPSHRINTFTVLQSDPICRKWPVILRTIVRKMDHTGVCVVTCVRRGRGPGPKDSTITVLVVCNSEKPPSHRENSIARIRELLDKNYLSGVAVEFVQGYFARGGTSLSGRELDRRAVQMPSVLGQSLALEDAHNSGTLGGFLELKMPGQDYITVGLTCFHCVNPSEKGLDPKLLTRVRLWRQNGIAPDDDMRTRLQLEHPSSSAIKEKVRSLENEIRELEGDKEYIQLCKLVSEGLQGQLGRRADQIFFNMSKTLSDLKGFLQDIKRFQAAKRASFGPVYAASGFRATASTNGKASNLDWALIEVPHDRVGENKTPDGYYLKDSPKPAKLDDVPLFIHGQRSGYCKGKNHRLESAKLEHEIEDGKPITRNTFEYSIFPQSGIHFSEGGDSGALVLTEDHVVVGMLFGGVVSGSDLKPMFSYWTPIEVLIEDIKNITKATNVRLKMNRPGTSP